MTTSLKIQDFKNNIVDVNRPNRFTVQFITPFINAGSESVTYTVSSSKVPNYEISTIPLKFLSQAVVYRGSTKFEDLDLTFIDDIQNNARTLITSWMNYIKNFNTPGAARNTNSYLQASMVLSRYDILNNNTSTYTLYNTIPFKMEAIDLNMTKPSEASTFKVSFKFSYYDIKMSDVNYTNGVNILGNSGIGGAIGSFLGSITSPMLSGIEGQLTGNLESIAESAIMGQGFNISGLGAGILNNAKSSAISSLTSNVMSGVNSLVGGIL